MFDSVLGWVFGAVALVIALMAAGAAGKLLGIESPPGRNVAIDGLRGYLAFGVFLHHAAVWYAYARTQTWGLPPPSMYRELAATCVSLFFMITAYLFVGKLLDARTRPVDWLGLYVSRVLRLAPLYLVSMFVLFAMVGVLSGWRLQEPTSQVAAEIGHWLGFTMIKAPDINALPGTTFLMAGVTWSLAYEWLFYLSLPALAVLFRVKVPLWLVAVSMLFVVLLLMNKPNAIFPTAFVKGAIAAVAARQARIAGWLRRPVFGLAVLFAAWVAMFGHAPNIVVTLLLTAAFCIVGCGNTVFGLLSNRPAIVLGDVSYGIYLLHGLLLSTTFFFLLGTDRAAALGPVEHWAVVTMVGVAVVIVSSLSYKLLEKPAMDRSRRVTGWLRSLRTPAAGVGAVDSSRPS